ncbi:hypothetical protein ACIBCM_30325 [Streptomyces sp. NPDC051018]|uniref:hypothetical protein n=1 Tax=Streptomyces sp. NPDC051018 TaxID=3365639 RepID=UPI0037A81772
MPPAGGATVEDLVRAMLDLMPPPGFWDQFLTVRYLRPTARLCARRGASGLAGELIAAIARTGPRIAASAETALILARAGRTDEARAVFAVAREHADPDYAGPDYADPHSRVVPWEPEEAAVVEAALGGAFEALGDRARADLWFSRARESALPETAPSENRFALLWALLESGRTDDEIRALWRSGPWDDARTWGVHLGRTRRRDLYEEFLTAWEAECEKTGGRAREEFALAVSVVRLTVDHLGPVAAFPAPRTPSRSDIADLNAEYESLPKVPGEERECSTELLIETAARRGHLAAVLHLVPELPQAAPFSRFAVVSRALRTAIESRCERPW